MLDRSLLVVRRNLVLDVSTSDMIPGSSSNRYDEAPIPTPNRGWFVLRPPELDDLEDGLSGWWCCCIDVVRDGGLKKEKVLVLVFPQ